MSHYVFHSYLNAKVRSTFTVEAENKEEASRKFSSGERTFVGEEVTADDHFDQEVEEVSPEDAAELRKEEYTVIGTSPDHPDGFTRSLKAEGPQEAVRAVEEERDAQVQAVFEGSHANLIA